MPTRKLNIERSSLKHNTVSRRHVLGLLAAGTSLATVSRRATARRRAQDTDSGPSASDLVFLTVGDYDCTIVNDGFFTLPNPEDFLFGSPPQDELDEALTNAGIDPATWESYDFTTSGFVIEAADQTVLVDVGAGNLLPTAGEFPANLHTAGIAPTDIDIVFLTHGHADHIAGVVDETGNPAFPDATYMLSRTEWEFWLGDPDLSSLRLSEDIKTLFREVPKAVFPPIENQVELIEGETELTSGVTALPAPGHTPGHFAVEVASEGERFIHLGDVSLHPLHVAHPEWVSVSDYAVDQTVTTRQNMYAQVAQSNAEVLGYHFPAPGTGHIRDARDGWQWTPVKSG